MANEELFRRRKKSKTTKERPCFDAQPSPLFFTRNKTTTAPLNFVPVVDSANANGSSGLPPLMPQPQQQHQQQQQQQQQNFPFLNQNNHFRPGVAASAPGRFGHLDAAASSLPVVACSPGSELSTAFTLACDIFDEIDERTAAAAAAAAAGVGVPSHFAAFGRSPALAAGAAARPPVAPPSLAGIQEEANAAAAAAATAAAAASLAAHGEEKEEKLRGLDFDDDGCFDDDGGDDDEMLLAALEGVPRPIVNHHSHSHHHHHSHHNPFASSSYTPGSAGPLADSYGSTGDELAGFGAGAGERINGNNRSHHQHPLDGPSSLASSSYGGLGASGTHFAALSPSVGAHHHQHSAAAAALRRVQSAAAMNGGGGNGGAFSFGAANSGNGNVNGGSNGVGGIGSSLAAAAAAAAAAATPNGAIPSSSAGGYAALAAAGGLGGITSAATATTTTLSGGGGGRMLSSSAPRSGARGPRHGMGFGGSLGGRNPLSVSSSPSLKALSSSLGGGRGGGSGTGDGGGSASSSFNENHSTSRDGTPSHYGSYGAQPSRSGRIPRPPRRPLDGYSDDEGGGAGGSGTGRFGDRTSYGSFGSAAGRKVHNPWSVEETDALVRGVETCGGGRWADIKKLNLPELEGRSAVDLKDKWRNLARLVALPSATPRSVAVTVVGSAPGSAAPGSSEGGAATAAGNVERRKLPSELLERVRLLLPTSPAMPYGRITPSRVPGARARKRR